MAAAYFLLDLVASVHLHFGDFRFLLLIHFVDILQKMQNKTIFHFFKKNLKFKNKYNQKENHWGGRPLILLVNFEWKFRVEVTMNNVEMIELYLLAVLAVNKSVLKLTLLVKQSVVI